MDRGVLVGDVLDIFVGVFFYVEFVHYQRCLDLLLSGGHQVWSKYSSFCLGFWGKTLIDIDICALEFCPPMPDFFPLLVAKEPHNNSTQSTLGWRAYSVAKIYVIGAKLNSNLFLQQ